MGNDNVFKPTAAAGGAAPQSGKTQTDGLLVGGWNQLGQQLAGAYAVQRLNLGTGSAVANSDSDVIAPTSTPNTIVSASRTGLGGFLGSPMGLGLIAVVLVGGFFLLRKKG